jgi:hypothetical protein
VSVRSTPLTLVAALALVAFAAPARAQSLAGAPVAPAPAAPVLAAPATASPPTDFADAPSPVAAKPSLAAPLVEEQRPLVAAPAAATPKRVPLAKRWWFWAGLGTAAVGIVLAAIFLGPKDPYSGNAQPGIVPLF